MTALGRVLASTTVVPFTPATYDQVFGSLPSGIAVTPETSLAIPAVYACTAVISEDIASVPLQVFARRGDGKELAPDHPIYELLHDQPNCYQSALEFREMVTAFALLRGKGIAEIVPGRRGPVDQLKPLYPDLIRSEVTGSGQLRYRYQDPIEKRERVLLAEDVFVVSGRFGRSVLAYARDTFGLALSMQRHAEKTYTRAARPAGGLRHPGKLSPIARQNLKEAIDSYAAGGDNEGRPMLLEEGMEWQSIALTMKDAEFLATFQWSVPQVARFFRVALHKIQDLTKSSFSNIEQQSIEHVTDTIRPWAERWEQAIRRDLITSLNFYAEHNLEGLLRGDVETRYAAYAVGRQWGWLSTNDIRRRENMNPIEGGDEDYLTPLNMTTQDGRLLAFAQPPKPALDYLRAMVRDAAARVVRKETAHLAKLGQQHPRGSDQWFAGLPTIAAEQADFAARLLRLPEEAATRYAVGRRDAVAAGLDFDETQMIAELTDFALEHRTDLAA